MSPEVAKRLYERYPEILGDIYFECGDGWADTIDDLCAELRAVSPFSKFVQVKNKFGILRVYLSDATDAGYDAARDAERLTMTICEHCGEEGKRNHEGWIMCLCKPCRVKWEARIK